MLSNRPQGTTEIVRFVVETLLIKSQFAKHQNVAFNLGGAKLVKEWEQWTLSQDAQPTDF